MWSTIIISIFTLILMISVNYVYRKRKEVAKVAREGGMDYKYVRLIGLLFPEDSETEILKFKVTSDSILIEAKAEFGYTGITFLQGFGHLHVGLHMMINGKPIKQKLTWKFPEYSDQEAMAFQINYDIIEHLKRSS